MTMDIVERREHDGAWWGRSTDGAWFRWSTASAGWQGPFAPPWPPEPPPLTPEEEAIVAMAMATAAAPQGPPMNRVDAWWNRHFPPFSIRRLAFGLVALPVIGAIVELLWVVGGREASLPRYLFVCIAGGAMLAIAWLPGMREMAERIQSSGAIDTRSPWPWRRRKMAPPPPPLPPLRETFRRDFLVALPFAFAMMIVLSLTVVGFGDTVAPTGLVTSAVAALFSAALIALRTSVWSIVFVSIAGGLLGGLAMVFLSVMTFSDPGLGGFVVGWGLGTVMVFLFAYPMWRGVRDLEARGFRLPMWIVMGGSVLLVSGAALVFLAER
jgi:hypothetical protein